MCAIVDVQKLIDGIQQLQQVREKLLAGDLSPPGAWIHEYEVRRLYAGSGNVEVYRYAKWQAHEPIFNRSPKRKGRLTTAEGTGLTKHQHIGRVSSSTGLGLEPAVADAYQSWHDRKRLEEIERALQEVQAVLFKALGTEG